MRIGNAARDPWVWGQMVMIALVITLAPFLPRHVNLGALDFPLNRIDPDWIRWWGAPVLLAGLAMSAWGVWSLGPSLTPGTEPLPESPLATTGAYAYVRHPIYLGLVLLLAGYTLACSNWTLALVVAFATSRYLGAKAKVEERWLTERHPLYRSYSVHVPRRLF